MSRVEVTVSDLKQWVYCPRIVYFHHLMSGGAKPTWKMEEGKLAEDMFERLEVRRRLEKYQLAGATRRFRVWLRDEDMGLSGKADLLLCNPEEVCVVDFKLTSGEPGLNHRMQVTAYSMLAERALGLAARRAFVYRIPDSRLFELDVNEADREMVWKAMAGIRRMCDLQELPEATSVRRRCVECEYQNFCADIW